MKFLKKYPKEITVKVSKKYTKRLIKINSITKSDKNVMLPRGVFALRVLQNCLLQHKQLENIRRLFLPLTRKTAKVWYNGNFTIPVTKKAAGNRMGKGKGKLDAWVSVYKKGDLIMEFEDIPEEKKLLHEKLLKSLKHKLPFRFQFLKKNSIYAQKLHL